MERGRRSATFVLPQISRARGADGGVGAASLPSPSGPSHALNLPMDREAFSATLATSLLPSLIALADQSTLASAHADSDPDARQAKQDVNKQVRSPNPSGTTRRLMPRGDGAGYSAPVNPRRASSAGAKPSRRATQPRRPRVPHPKTRGRGPEEEVRRPGDAVEGERASVAADPSLCSNRDGLVKVAQLVPDNTSNTAMETD